MAERAPAVDSNPKDEEENHEPEKSTDFPTKPCFIVLSVCFFALFILIITTVAVQAWAYLSMPNIPSTQFSLFKCTDCDPYMHGKSFSSLKQERCANSGWNDGLCELYVAMDRASIVVIVCEISILVMIIMVLERLAFHMASLYYGEKNILHVLAILMMGAQATALGYWVQGSNVTWDDACRVDSTDKPMLCGDTGAELLIVVFLLTEILCLGLIFGVYKTKTIIEQKREYYSIGKISQQGCICGLFFYLLTVVFVMVLCMALHDWVTRSDNFPFDGSLFSRRESDGTTSPYNLLANKCDWQQEPGQCRLWDRLELASIDYVYVETVSWIFIVLWMQGIIGAAVRRHYAKPVITLAYGGLACVFHFVAIVVWFGRSHARFGDCTEFNLDAETVPDVCGTHAPKLSIALIFMLLIGVVWYAVAVLAAKVVPKPPGEAGPDVLKFYKQLELEDFS